MAGESFVQGEKNAFTLLDERDAETLKVFCRGAHKNINLIAVNALLERAGGRFGF